MNSCVCKVEEDAEFEFEQNKGLTDKHDLIEKIKTMKYHSIIFYEFVKKKFFLYDLIYDMYRINLIKHII